MNDRDRTYHTIWFVVVIVALAGWNVYQFRQANTERGELRARISELFVESESATDEARSATDEARSATSTLEFRERRFRLQAAACARLINGLEREAWSEGDAIGRVIRGEWSAAELEEWAIGEAQYQAYLGYSTNQNRSGCGMRITNPNDFRGPREVEPVKRAWVDGAEPVEG
ncbi:MAG: hypothetical protein WEE66_02080 [Actinomycetota bacterium]